jgi:HSP20 family protein
MADKESQPESPLTASVEKLRHELDRWLEFAVTQGERAMEAIRPRGGETQWMPAIDVVESANEILVVVDLPGTDPNSVDLSLAGNMLTVSGHKPATPTEEEQAIHVGERMRGPFSRSIPMPAPVDPDTVSAESQNGVVQIRIGKVEQAKARKIHVATPQEASTGEASPNTDS